MMLQYIEKKRTIEKIYNTENKENEKK